MKTGMEWPLLGLVVLVALGFLWNMWSGMQVDLAVAATTASAAGTTVPAPVMIGGQWIVNAIIGTLIGAAVTAFIAGMVVWFRKQIKIQNAKPEWKSGPNANWGQQRPPKPMSEAELYRLMLMQQMGVDRAAPRPSVTRMEGEDEPTINF